MHLSEILIKDHYSNIIDPIFNLLVLHEIKYNSNYQKRFLPEYYSNAKIISTNQLEEITGNKIDKRGYYYHNLLLYYTNLEIKKLADYVLMNHQGILYYIDKYRSLDNSDRLKYVSSFKIRCKDFILRIDLNIRLLSRKIPIININYFPSNMIRTFYRKYEYINVLYRRASILHYLISISEYNHEFRKLIPELSNWLIGDDNDYLTKVNPYFMIDLNRLNFLDKSKYRKYYFPLNDIEVSHRLYIRKENIRLGTLKSTNHFNNYFQF